MAEDSPGVHQRRVADAHAAAVEPVDADGVGVAVAGTCLWVVAGIVLWLGFGERLAANDAQWWLWVCVVGALLGFVGLGYVLRRRAVYRRHALLTSSADRRGQSPS